LRDERLLVSIGDKNIIKKNEAKCR